MNDTASAAPVRDYPPLPDFETVEQHIYGACRRYITQDMLEPIHNLIRDAIDADRAMRAQAAPASQDAATRLKDGDIAALVNRLRDIAIEYSDTQQLRERIASEIRPRAAGLVRVASQDAEDAALIEALERVYLWMDRQSDAQSKGGHATFDLMMLREERDAVKAAIDAARAAQGESK